VYKRDPFAVKAPPGWGVKYTRWCTAKDQIDQIRRNFTAAECRAALRLPDLAKTVRAAAEAKLRRLERAHPTNRAK
jgi:hypothetical protein